MEIGKIRELVENVIEKTGGILHLEPAWVARKFHPPGRRLGLKESNYELGLRGAYVRDGSHRQRTRITKSGSRTKD